MTDAPFENITIDTFERGDIDVEGFGHEAHVYAGWLYVNRFPVPLATERFAAALRRLTTKLGAADKYHDTITRFYLLLIAERIDGSTCWPRFREQNPDLFDRDNNVLYRYYSRERLSSDTARQHFLLPDQIAA